MEGSDFKSLEFLNQGCLNVHYLSVKFCKHIDHLGGVLRSRNLRMLHVDEKVEIMKEIDAYGEEIRGEKEIISSHGSGTAQI